MKERALTVLKRCLVILSIGIAYALIYRFTGFGLKCPVKALTGYLCPGCGITRMSMAILRLDFISAFHYNPVLLCILPVLLIIKAERSYKYIKYGKVTTSKFETAIIYAMLICLLVFGVLRNIV